MQILNVEFQWNVTPTFLNFASFGCHFITQYFHLIFNHDSDPENFWYQEGEKVEIHTGIQLISNQGFLAEKFSITAPKPPGPQIYYKQDKRTLELRV
jgi:hypothetical protein